MRKRAFFLASTLIVGLAPFAESRADLILVDDFSNTVNTSTSELSYRHSTDLVRDGSYTLLPTNSDQGIWNPATLTWNTGAEVPSIGVNRSGGAVTAGSVSWPDQTVYMHPGAGGLVAVSWLSPSTTLVDIEFTFTDIDTGGVSGGVNWFVDLGSSSGNLASGTLTNGGTSGTQSLSNVNVVAGNRINFVVGPNGSHAFDGTTLVATITTIPEPHAWSFIAVAACLVSVYPASKRLIPRRVCLEEETINSK